MPDPLADHGDLNAVMRLVETKAEAYLDAVDDAPVRSPGVPRLDGGLPAHGAGSLHRSTAQRAREDRASFTSVERHLRLAQRVAQQVDDADDLERLAELPLNVICFCFRPLGFPEAALDDLNLKLGSMVLEDGRVYVGPTDYAGKVAFRPAIVNWRTREQDVDLIVKVVRELGVKLASSASAASL